MTKEELKAAMLDIVRRKLPRQQLHNSLGAAFAEFTKDEPKDSSCSEKAAIWDEALAEVIHEITTGEHDEAVKGFRTS